MMNLPYFNLTTAHSAQADPPILLERSTASSQLQCHSDVDAQHIRGEFICSFGFPSLTFADTSRPNSKMRLFRLKHYTTNPGLSTCIQNVARRALKVQQCYPPGKLPPLVIISTKLTALTHLQMIFPGHHVLASFTTPSEPRTPASLCSQRYKTHGLFAPSTLPRCEPLPTR